MVGNWYVIGHGRETVWTLWMENAPPMDRSRSSSETFAESVSAESADIAATSSVNAVIRACFTSASASS